MAPKKKEGAATPAPRNTVFSEVDRAMLELQIADLNRKLARLRKAVDEYEQRNIELQNAYDQLDEDRADIIAYLKKTLATKNDENNELKDRVKSLEDLREIETAQFKEKVIELEKNFTIMKDQLTSENKLLGGKLNTLEEFRAIRDALMLKFEKQEEEFEAQEMKYKRVIYETEKKFVIGKDKLKKEMEARLLQLAQDFQDASESRIAASTHRVIRENIALNNQLDSLLLTQAKVAEQNEKYREDERAARNAMEIAESEKDKAINKSIVQLKVIDQLTNAYQSVQQNKALHDKKVYDFENLQAKVHKLTKQNENMTLQIKILEQNLHSRLGEQNKTLVETAKLTKERDKYKALIKDTAFAVQAALKVDQWASVDPTREILERKVVLTNILNVINKHRRAMRAESVESLISLTDVYEKGDLGFIPKPKVDAKMKSRVSLSTTRSQETLQAKRSSQTISLTASSLGSVKTVPSIELIPHISDISIASKESIPSFTVTSIHSHESVSETEHEDSFEDLTDVEKQLAMSKLEIQKSILKDLAVSRTAFHSKSRVEIVEPVEPTSKSKLDVTETKIKLTKEHAINVDFKSEEHLEGKTIDQGVNENIETKDTNEMSVENEEDKKTTEEKAAE